MFEENIVKSENDQTITQIDNYPDSILQTEDDALMIGNIDIDYIEDVEMKIDQEIFVEETESVNLEKNDKKWKPRNVDSDDSWAPSGTKKPKTKKKKRRIRYEPKKYNRIAKTCPICGKTYKGIGQHMLSHDTEGALKKFECDICGIRFHQWYQIQKHVITHTTEQRFQCTQNGCERRFKTKPGLVAHIATAHSESRSFKCKICGKTFKTKNLLCSHNKVHVGRFTNKCIYCPDNFSRQPELITHIEIIHADKNHKFYNCPDCDTKHVSEKKLKKHFRLVHAKKVQCHICGLKFYHQSVLDSHMYKHLNEKPDFLKCKDCDKEFSSLIALKRHSLKHTDTILHNCEICGKGYTRLDSYKVHMKGHAK